MKRLSHELSGAAVRRSSSAQWETALVIVSCGNGKHFLCGKERGKKAAAPSLLQPNGTDTDFHSRTKIRLYQHTETTHEFTLEHFSQRTPGESVPPHPPTAPSETDKHGGFELLSSYDRIVSTHMFHYKVWSLGCREAFGLIQWILGSSCRGVLRQDNYYE